MSKEDIEKAVQDAEKFAEEDKKRREEVDTRNEADQMVYQCEKILSEEGAKFDESDKSELQSKIDALKNALNGQDINLIKNEKDALTQAFYKISEKLYQQANPQGAQGGPQGFNPNDFAGGAQGGFNPNDFNQSGTSGDGYTDAGYTDANFTDAN